MTTDAQYPIGRFTPPATFTPEVRAGLIADIEAAPAALAAVLRGLTVDQLRTPYREGGWMVKQVAHHLPDSHINAYVRFRRTLTEDEPTTVGYRQAKWADLADAESDDVQMSVDLLTALHRRWVILLRSLTAEQLERRFVHPDRGLMPLDQLLALYAWHGRHHVAQIAALREREGW
jgi:uncharacterized damage-inducible protein DinB